MAEVGLVSLAIILLLLKAIWFYFCSTEASESESSTECKDDSSMSCCLGAGFGLALIVLMRLIILSYAAFNSFFRFLSTSSSFSLASSPTMTLMAESLLPRDLLSRFLFNYGLRAADP